jgi:hypothetical protein
LDKNYNEYNDTGINYKEMISYPKDDIRDSKLYVKKKTNLIKNKINSNRFNNKVEGFTSGKNNVEEFSNIDNIRIRNNKCKIEKNGIPLIIFLIIFIVIVYIINRKM